jgi:hypothetical protein
LRNLKLAESDQDAAKASSDKFEAVIDDVNRATSDRKDNITPFPADLG